MNGVTHLEQLLLRLDADAHAVATTLRAAGIKGTRNTIRNLNPVVRFVQLQLRVDNYNLEVLNGNGGTDYVLHVLWSDGTEGSIAFPRPVKEFLDAFNSGAFPDLELPLDAKL
jgi:hypothetical protein